MKVEVSRGLSLRGEDQAGDRSGKQECVVREGKSKSGVVDVGRKECASRRGLVVHDEEC